MQDKHSLNRRDYLIQSSAWTAGCVALASMAMPANSVMGIEPIRRAGKPRFSFSLAAYSYRSLLQARPTQFTLFDFIDDCAEFGLQGAELTSYYFDDPCTNDYLRQLKRHCFRLGVDISGTAIRCDFGVAPGPKRDKEVADVKRWIERAEILGAPVIRIFAGHVPEGRLAEEVHPHFVAGIQECCEYAGQHGVHLALENHGGPTGTAAGLLAIVREVDSPWFGVNLDTGNFHSEDVYAELAEAAPYAINVQVKVVVSSPDKQKVPTDFSRVADILRSVDYAGYVVLEYEEDEDPRQESRRYCDILRKAFA